MNEKRAIIEIDEKKCDGCGACIPNCPEGALQIIDGKARLVSDLFCDGLGACLGHCPQAAISIHEREAEAYNETRVMENIVKQGANTISAHLRHLREHNEMSLYQEAVAFLQQQGRELPPEEPRLAQTAGGCPGSRAKTLLPDNSAGMVSGATRGSQLQNWPIQLKLVPVYAAYLKNAELVLAADCVGFTYPDFNPATLAGKVLLIACPKLDDNEFYIEKLTSIIEQNQLRSITIFHMEVPCCFGLMRIVEQALRQAKASVPVVVKVVSIQGSVIE